MQVFPPADPQGSIEPIVIFIAKNLGKTLSIAIICKHFGTGRNALNQRFKAQTGLTIHAYIISERMKAAEKLLLSGIKVSAVARAVGYRNTAAFIRAFKSYFHQTPGARKTSN